jgi:hypothetical protein
MNLHVQVQVQIPHEMIQYRGWFLAFGIIVGLLGIAAVVRSFAATMASTLFFSAGYWPSPASRSCKPSWWVLGRLIRAYLAATLFGVRGLLSVTRPIRSASLCRN